MVEAKESGQIHRFRTTATIPLARHPYHSVHPSPRRRNTSPRMACKRSRSRTHSGSHGRKHCVNAIQWRHACHPSIDITLSPRVIGVHTPIEHRCSWSRNSYRESRILQTVFGCAGAASDRRYAAARLLPGYEQRKRLVTMKRSSILHLPCSTLFHITVHCPWTLPFTPLHLHICSFDLTFGLDLISSRDVE